MKIKLFIPTLFFTLSLLGFIVSFTVYASEKDRAEEFINKSEEGFDLAKPTTLTQNEIETTAPLPRNSTEYPSRLPVKDLSLSKENRISIPMLGVDTILNEGKDSEVALDKGAWIVGDFSTPVGNALVDNKPVIIASHLYGPGWWSDEYRLKTSFKGLQTLKQGDQFEVVWDQRTFLYEVEVVNTSTEIQSYDYDIIVYTCLDLSGSDERIIVYGNLLERNI